MVLIRRSNNTEIEPSQIALDVTIPPQNLSSIITLNNVVDIALSFHCNTNAVSRLAEAVQFHLVSQDQCTFLSEQIHLKITRSIGKTDPMRKDRLLNVLGIFGTYSPLLATICSTGMLLSLQEIPQFLQSSPCSNESMNRFYRLCKAHESIFNYMISREHYLYERRVVFDEVIQHLVVLCGTFPYY